MKPFLVLNRDAPIADAEPHLVIADSEQHALTKFMRQVYARSRLHRENILDISVNMGFSERFFLASEQEQERFNSTGKYGTEPEVVHSRVRAFFSERPALGELYLKYVDSKDEGLVTDELLEFVAIHLDPSEVGYVALELGSLPRLE